jgi:hypothetical protein
MQLKTPTERRGAEGAGVRGSRRISARLYYTGLTDTAKFRLEEDAAKICKLDREFKVKLPVTIPANDYKWFIAN